AVSPVPVRGSGRRGRAAVPGVRPPARLEIHNPGAPRSPSRRPGRFAWAAPPAALRATESADQARGGARPPYRGSCGQLEGGETVRMIMDPERLRPYVGVPA